MKKIVKIKIEKSFRIQCHFSNHEKRLFDLKQAAPASDGQHFRALLDETIFSTAHIGPCGELVWDNHATMIDANGREVHIGFDISPEFVYHHSVKI